MKRIKYTQEISNIFGSNIIAKTERQCIKELRNLKFHD